MMLAAVALTRQVWLLLHPTPDPEDAPEKGSKIAIIVHGNPHRFSHDWIGGSMASPRPPRPSLFLQGDGLRPGRLTLHRARRITPPLRHPMRGLGRLHPGCCPAAHVHSSMWLGELKQRARTAPPPSQRPPTPCVFPRYTNLCRTNLGGLAWRDAALVRPDPLPKGGAWAIPDRLTERSQKGCENAARAGYKVCPGARPALSPCVCASCHYSWHAAR